LILMATISGGNALSYQTAGRMKRLIALVLPTLPANHRTVNHRR
jgi:hypothetical protein